MIRATLSDLCHQLNLSRAQLNRALKRTGAPRPIGKKYDVAAVVTWVSKTTGLAGTSDELKRARIEEVRLRCARLRLDMKEREGKLLPKDFVDEYWTKVCRQARDAMFTILEGGLPVELAGLDAAQIRPKLRDAGDAICERLYTGLAEWYQEVAESYNKLHPDDEEI